MFLFCGKKFVAVILFVVCCSASFRSLHRQEFRDDKRWSGVNNGGLAGEYRRGVPERIETLLRYLWNKREIIVNDEERKGTGWCVASTQVEKWNDVCVSQRCKGRGMSWSLDGVMTIALYVGKIKHTTS